MKNEKHRFSSFEASKAGDVPENLWALGYKFQQPFNADGKVYFLPKGHNTVRLPGKGKGFLHGGATPEEVIVPTAFYKAVKVAWKHPFTRFLGLNPDKETGGRASDGYDTGSVIVNTLPLATSLSTLMVPLCRSIMPYAVESPRPSPFPSFLVVKKGSKM